MHNKTISFIGAGNMAKAMINGLIIKDYETKNIIASRRCPEKLSQLQQQYNIKTTTNNLIAADGADILVLAVKPQQLEAVCQQLKAMVKKQQPLILSVVTGKTIATIEQYLGTRELTIVRCVSNTPVQIGYGVTAAFAKIPTSSRQPFNKILNAMGRTVWLEQEAALDTVTALAGSGPAYYFYIIDAFINAAIKQGLSPEVAKILAEQTALGAAKMVQATNDSLAILQRQIASPGGTTEQGVKVLQNHHVDKILTEVIAKATQRATELAQM